MIDLSVVPTEVLEKAVEILESKAPVNVDKIANQKQRVEV